jgi:hypothetical protein
METIPLMPNIGQRSQELLTGYGCSLLPHLLEKYKQGNLNLALE